MQRMGLKFYAQLLTEAPEQETCPVSTLFTVVQDRAAFLYSVSESVFSCFRIRLRPYQGVQVLNKASRSVATPNPCCMVVFVASGLLMS